MFELFQRLGKVLKYGLQGIVWIITLIAFFSGTDIGELMIYMLTGLCFTIIIETISRVIVWIISGYFETNTKTNITPARLIQMREYYSCRHLRKNGPKFGINHNHGIMPFQKNKFSN